MRPRKRFGQHFLEPAWVTKLVAAIEPLPTDCFIEIGSGRGAITLPLASKVARLVAIEVDRDLAAALQERALPNVTVVTADVLKVDLGELARDTCGSDHVGGNEGGFAGLDAQQPIVPSTDRKVRIVGNLPYNISSPILFRLLETAASTGVLQDATLMLQKEVADRLLAQRGTGDYGVLTLSTALGAHVTSVLALPPGAFRPAPKVRSVVVRLTFRPAPASVHHPRLVIEIIRAVFTQRRKMLSNALAPFATIRGVSPHDALAAAGLDPRRRPETLELSEVARLADVLAG